MFYFASVLTLSKKKRICYLPLFSALFIPLWINSTSAQVSVNHSALDNLGPAKKSPSKPRQNRKNTKTAHKKIANASNSSKNTTSQSKQTTQPPIPSIPNAPPPNPVFRDPELDVPLHPPAPPAMPKINPSAQGNVVITPQHTIINFKNDNYDLNETMMKTVMELANTFKQHPDTQIYLNAYSHGTADDISTPRRNALNRGLTIRAVLINQGIPATRIYLIAKGIPDTTINKNPDYVEIIRSDLINKNNK